MKDKKINTYFWVKKTTSLILKHHYWSMFVAALIIISCSLGIRYIKFDFSHRVWFRPSDPLLTTFDSFQNKFGNDDNVILAVHMKNGLFNPASIKLIQTLTEGMWSVSDVVRVDSLTNFHWTHSKGDEIIIEPLFPKDPTKLSRSVIEKQKKVALGHENITGYLIAKDLKTTFIFAQMRPAFGTPLDFTKIIKDVRKLIDKYKSPDVEFHVSGSMAVSNTFKEVSMHDMKTIMPVLAVFLFLLLLYFFKNATGIFIPIVIIIVSTVTTLGIGGLLGLKLNNLTAMVPKILLAISLADVIHILATYFRSRKNGLLNFEAITKSYQKNFIPTLLTTISTAIGFFSCTTTDLIPIKYLGLLSGIGTILIWILSMLLIGPLLKIFSPNVRPVTSGESMSSRWSAKTYSLVAQYSTHIIVAFIIIFISSIISLSYLKVNSNPYHYFSAKTPLKIANDFINKVNGGLIGPEIVLKTGKADGIKDPKFLKKVDEFQSWLNQREEVNKTLSIVDIIKDTNRALHGNRPEEYKIPTSKSLVAEELFLYTMSLPQGMDMKNRISLDNESIRISVLWNIEDSSTTIKKVDEIEIKMKEMGLKGDLTGKLLLYQRMNKYVVSTFYRSIIQAFLFIAILMIIVFGSIRTGLFSMIPNVIPLGMGAGMMVVLGKDLDIATVVVTSVCLGIGVDDTIHFLSDYYFQKRSGKNDKQAIINIYENTAPSLIITTLILVFVFGVFVLGDFIPNLNFGIATAFILTCAVIADLILLPALIIKFNRLKKSS